MGDSDDDGRRRRRRRAGGRGVDGSAIVPEENRRALAGFRTAPAPWNFDRRASGVTSQRKGGEEYGKEDERPEKLRTQQTTNNDDNDDDNDESDE